ncbi:MAG TPA: DUF5666 domain-containing protein [Tepidisphaeraceae bacterium]|jgi:hypothetical protein|nr:DUF5666 domain-containing protein [Tepidisphaeraceae bacterium]
MKAWMTVLALAAILGFSSFADAKGAGKKGGGGMHGKITVLTGTPVTSFTMESGGKKNPHTVTVNVGTATIEGGTLAVGSHVSVVGTMDGNGNVTATTIKIQQHKPKGQKKPA